jgi:hypothetical protein
MSIFGKTYKLSLARNYVSSWGVVQAVREFIQNALDSDSPFEYEWESSFQASWKPIAPSADLHEDTFTLALVSRHSILRPEQLLLGGGTKAGDLDKIGSFGEGFKLALLVLTREGRPTTILNNGKAWTPTFEFDKAFGAEALQIEETDAPIAGSGVTVLISGLTQEEREKITDSCLLMQRRLGNFIEVPQGRILPDLPGRLYVGGLFICETKLQHGYDIRPNLLRLERDRQTVDNFELTWLVKDMWFASGKTQEVAEMIAAGAKDMEHADYGAPVLVREACYELFKKQHPGKVIAASQTEMKTMIEQGLTKVVFIGSSWGAVTREAPSYRADVTRKRAVAASPYDRLQSWFVEAKRHMHADAVRAFLPLLEESRRWELPK